MLYSGLVQIRSAHVMAKEHGASEGSWPPSEMTALIEVLSLASAGDTPQLLKQLIPES